MTVAAIFLTPSSMSFSLYKILGKSSAPTTVYANYDECFAMLAKVWQTCFFNWASWWFINWIKYGTAPESTTILAKSKECFDI